MRISVLMAVYGLENPLYLDQSLESLRRQTLKPAEIVLVLDGPLTPQLRAVIARHQKRKNPVLRTVPLSQSRGLGLALRAGLEQCRQEWVARMDSDDLCLPERFQLQADYLDLHPDLSALGGFIQEFEKDPQTPGKVRRVPLAPAHTRIAVKFRNPMNHMTVMFRKSHVLAAGSYRDFPFFEDYDLWCRMIAQGGSFANLPETLVLARFNEDSLRRRRGLGYIKRELRHLGNMRALGLVSWAEWGILSLAKTSVRLLPLGVLKGIYRNFLRITWREKASVKTPP